MRLSKFWAIALSLPLAFGTSLLTVQPASALSNSTKSSTNDSITDYKNCAFPDVYALGTDSPPVSELCGYISGNTDDDQMLPYDGQQHRWGPTPGGVGGYGYGQNQLSLRDYGIPHVIDNGNGTSTVNYFGYVDYRNYAWDTPSYATGPGGGNFTAGIDHLVNRGKLESRNVDVNVNVPSSFSNLKVVPFETPNIDANEGIYRDRNMDPYYDGSPAFGTVVNNQTRAYNGTNALWENAEAYSLSGNTFQMKSNQTNLGLERWLSSPIGISGWWEDAGEIGAGFYGYYLYSFNISDKFLIQATVSNSELTNDLPVSFTPTIGSKSKTFGMSDAPNSFSSVEAQFNGVKTAGDPDSTYQLYRANNDSDLNALSHDGALNSKVVKGNSTLEYSTKITNNGFKTIESGEGPTNWTPSLNSKQIWPWGNSYYKDTNLPDDIQGSYEQNNYSEFRGLRQYNTSAPLYYEVDLPNDIEITSWSPANAELEPYNGNVLKVPVTGLAPGESINVSVEGKTSAASYSGEINNTMYCSVSTGIFKGSELYYAHFVSTDSTSGETTDDWITGPIGFINYLKHLVAISPDGKINNEELVGVSTVKPEGVDDSAFRPSAGIASSNDYNGIAYETGDSIDIDYDDIVQCLPLGSLLTDLTANLKLDNSDDSDGYFYNSKSISVSKGLVGLGNSNTAYPVIIPTITSEPSDGNPDDPGDNDVNMPSPKINQPTNNSVVKTSTTVVQGTGEAGDTLTVYNGTDVFGTTTVKANGKWSMISPLLGDRENYNLIAKQKNGLGKISDMSNRVKFSVSFLSDPRITTPKYYQTITTRTPVVAGTGEPGYTITVYASENGWGGGGCEVCRGTSSINDNISESVKLGTAKVDSAGKWIMTASEIDENLFPESVNLVAVQKDSYDSVRVYFPYGEDPVQMPVPNIVEPYWDSTVHTTTPVISGTGEPGDVVTVKENNYSDEPDVLGTTTVDNYGTWSMVSKEIALGYHEIVAYQFNSTTDLTSDYSDSINFNVDTIVPVVPISLAPPTIVTPENNLTTEERKPSISGTGVKNSSLTVYENANVVGTTMVGEDGSWTLIPTNDLDYGYHNIIANQVEPLTDEMSGMSNSTKFKVQSNQTPPVVITAPEDNSTVNTRWPIIFGTGAPGDQVKVYEGNSLLGETTVDNLGSWTMETNGLDVGAHSIQAIQSDLITEETTSDPSNIVNFTVELSSPVITSPADGSTVNTLTPTARGNGATGNPDAGWIIWVEEQDSDGNYIGDLGMTTSNPDGTWSVESNELVEGDHIIYAYEYNTETYQMSGISDLVNFTIDLSAVPGAPAAPAITAPSNGSTISLVRPPISGTGIAGDTLNAYEGIIPIGTTTVNTDGTWSITPEGNLIDGDHSVYSTQTDPGTGLVSINSNTVNFIVHVPVTPPAPAITAPVQDSTVTVSKPTINGTGETGNTVTVKEGTTIIGTATVVANGTWTLIPGNDFTNASHTIVANQKNSDNLTSVNSVEITFTVAVPQAQAPAAPIFTAPVEGSTVKIARPTISGTGEIGDTVTIKEGTKTICNAIVGIDSIWSCVPIVAFTTTSRSVTLVAVQKNATSGLTSVDSLNLQFTVSLPQTPKAPQITLPVVGSTVKTGTPTISGPGNDGNIVTVKEGTTVLGTTTVGTDDKWALVPTTPLDNGSHSVVATQKNSDDLTSPNSTVVKFTVDRTPAVPTIVTPANNTVVNVRRPIITGNGEIGDTVTVKLGGSVMGTTVVNGSGNWALTAPSDLANGNYFISAFQTNSELFKSLNTPDRAFSVAVFVTAAAPIIIAPVNGSTTTDSTPIISGTGEADATLTVMRGATLICSTIVNTNGTWACGSPVLPEGSVTLTATQKNGSGVNGPSDTVTFNVDLAGIAPVITTPINGSTIFTTTPTISGTGEVNSVVTVIRSGSSVCTATVNGAGNWSCISPALPNGAITMTATQKDSSGNVSPSDSVTFIVNTDPTLMITGKAQVKQTLTATVVRMPSGTRINGYRWYRNGRQISHSSKSTYKATQSDYNKTVYAQVDMVNSTTRKRISLKSNSVYVLPAPMTVTSRPKVTGLVKLGNTVHLSKGHWSPAPSKYTYRWMLDGVAIPGATKSSYRIPSTARGKKISIEVTGTKTGYAATPSRSTEIPLPGAPLVVKTAPKLSGKFKVNYTVKVSSGSWTPSATKYSYQWMVDGINVSGATKSSFKILSNAKGKYVSARVTASRSGYAPAATNSSGKIIP